MELSCAKNSPPSPKHSQSGHFGTLPLTGQYLCDLRDTMPCHWSPRLSTQPLPREAEDFPKGGKYPKDVHLPTFLAYLQPV